MNDTKLQLILFPLWWYSEGVHLVWQWARRRFHHRVQATGFTLFVRHMSEPLYGDYTRSGRLISFFLRVVLLFFKVAWLGAYALGLAFLMILYLALLPLSIVMIVYQIFPF